LLIHNWGYIAKFYVFDRDARVKSTEILSEGELSKVLLSAELLRADALERARQTAKSTGTPLDRVLLKLGLLAEDVLLPRLAQILEIPSINATEEVQLDETTLATLTPTYCGAHPIAPIYLADGQAAILSPDPANAALREELSFHLEQPIEFAAAPTRIVRTLLQEAQDKGAHAGGGAQISPHDSEAALQAGIDGPVIRFVAEILEDAVALGASDLHFETREHGLALRLRIQGRLQAHRVEPSLSPSAIQARVKVMAGMNVSERRLPQDGRISATIAGRKVDFRVSSLPTRFGESIVARVLDPGALLLGWDRLGFEPDLITQIQTALAARTGLFLVTGPTGSGKTTTLYTALSELRSPEIKILTVEDPIEYVLNGVEQVQVHEEIGMSFARALRAFLRQDPNIIMVGEIRDEETAEIAARTALAGRLVLSTLHTNSPDAAPTRLKDLGVPSYIINDTLRGALGQTLEITKTNRKLKAKFWTPGR
jgi:general secretion pathway protein E